MPSDSFSAADVLSAARELLPWMVEIRRDLHRHPELGLEEHRTSARIRDLLEELDIDYVSGLAETGILGFIRGRDEGRAVALRADMDALPIQEANDVSYKSQVPGKMHACGHDVHMTILLGAARLLAEKRDELPGMVKLVFQPAEETVGGAKLLIEEGILEDPRVEAIFGLHVEPDVEIGRFELRYGQRNASSDAVRITVLGQTGHAAYPAECVDAIVIAAQVISAVQTVVSRNVDARDSAVVSFGKIHGGMAENVVADRVEMSGTIRCLDPAVREHVLKRLRETAEGVASALGGRAEVDIEPGYAPLVNNDAMVDLVRNNLDQLVGADNVSVKDRPNMGVEDFAYYVSRVPGAFFALGVRNEKAGIVHPIHNGRFDVDEECLAYGAAVQALNAWSTLRTGFTAGAEPASSAAISPVQA